MLINIIWFVNHNNLGSPLRNDHAIQTPSSLTFTTNHNLAKQLDRSLFGSALLGHGCSLRTTWSDNQMHHAAKQLDDNATADADANANVSDALKSRERILSAHQRMYV